MRQHIERFRAVRPAFPYSGGQEPDLILAKPQAGHSSVFRKQSGRDDIRLAVQPQAFRAKRLKSLRGQLI